MRPPDVLAPHWIVSARFLRFLIVGCLNTAFGYALFWCALALMPTPFIALGASTILAVLFNFFSTGALVFDSRDSGRIRLFFGVYAVVFAYNATGLMALEHIGIGPEIGGLLLLPGAVTISWLLNSKVVFRERQ